MDAAGRSLPSSFESALHELVTALNASPDQSPALSPDPEFPCALCRLTARSVERQVRTFLSEYVNDPAPREVLRRAQGFCAGHTRVLAAIGDPLAIAILYSDLARLTRERWEQTKPGSARGGFWPKLRAGKMVDVPLAPCPACVVQQEADGRYVRALASGLDKPEVWTALRAHPGLCAAHVSQVVAQAAPNHAASLLQLESQRLADLQAELEEIIRKNDYRFRSEEWGAEKDAWRRALDKLRRIV